MPDGIVLFAWVRDLDGDSELITGGDSDGIYARAGQWCMARLRRAIPAIVTCLCRIGGLHFTFSYAIVPERRGELRKQVDEIIAFEAAGQVTCWYVARQDAAAAYDNAVRQAILAYQSKETRD